MNDNFTVPHANIQLVAYERVNLQVNQTVSIDFTITPEQMAVYYDIDEAFIVFPSRYLLLLIYWIIDFI